MQNRFFYCRGPFGDLERYPEIPLDGERSDPPLVISSLHRLELDDHRAVGTLRRNWRRTHDVAQEDDLDRILLESGTAEAERYRSLLVKHLSGLVSSYRKLGGNVLIVPGPFDLLPDRINEVCEAYNFQDVLKRLDSGDIACQFLDDRTINLPDVAFSITGISHRRTTVPDLPELWLRPGTLQTDPEPVGTDNPGDIIVSSNGFEGDQPGGRQGTDRYPPVSLDPDAGSERLLLDGCMVRGKPFDALGRYRNSPRIHGLVAEVEHGLWSVDVQPPVVDVRLFERGVKRLDARYSEGQWTLRNDQAHPGASRTPSTTAAPDDNEHDVRTDKEKAPGSFSTESRGTFDQKTRKNQDAAEHEQDGFMPAIRSITAYARSFLPTVVLTVMFLAISVPIGIYLWDVDRGTTSRSDETRPQLVELNDNNLRKWMEISNALAQKMQQGSVGRIRSGTLLGFSSELQMQKQLANTTRQICVERNYSFPQFLNVTRTIGIHAEHPEGEASATPDYLRKHQETDEQFSQNQSVYQENRSSIQTVWKQLSKSGK